MGTEWVVRKASLEDMERIMAIFNSARSFMRRSGNASQWINGYPTREIIIRDIEDGNFYIICHKGRVSGCFSLIIGEEPTYQNIRGAWADNEPYGTIHRLASDGTIKGIADECFAFCRLKISNLRADTHKDNIPMQRALERTGFKYCGIIHVADGSERLAYQLH